MMADGYVIQAWGRTAHWLLAKREASRLPPNADHYREIEAFKRAIEDSRFREIADDKLREMES